MDFEVCRAYASASHSSSILHPSFTLSKYHAISDWRLDMKPKYSPDLMDLAAIIIAVIALLRTEEKSLSQITQ
jgi:hypothetical protein